MIGRADHHGVDVASLFLQHHAKIAILARHGIKGRALGHQIIVHVGQSDLAPAVVRPIVGTERVVGVSTHTVEQIDAAVLEPVDYVAVGPVFGTSTKQSAYQAVGLDRVREAARKAHARSLPVVAIGGITIDRAADVIDAGAASVAVISDLLASDDPEARVRAYLHALA